MRFITTILITVFLIGNYTYAQDMPSIYVPEYEDCKCKPKSGIAWSSNSPPDNAELHSQIVQLSKLVEQQKEELYSLTQRIKILENPPKSPKIPQNPREFSLFACGIISLSSG